MYGVVTLALDWPSNWGNDVRDQQIVPLLNQIGSAGFDIGLLAKDPASVFPQAWTVFQKIAVSAIQPVALTVLSVILMFSLLQASTRIDADRDLGVRMVVSTLFKAVVCIGLTQNASQLGELLTTTVSRILTGVQETAGVGKLSMARKLGDTLKAQNAIGGDLMTNVGIVMSLFIPALLATIVGVLVQAIVYLRFIQIYLYTALSGLGVAFFASQYTRSWGESYVRSFASVVFKSVTLYLGLYLYSVVAKTTALNISGYNASHQITANGGWLSGVWLSLIMLLGVLMVSQKAADALFGR